MVSARVTSLTRRTLMAAMPSVLLPTPGIAADLRPDHWAEPVQIEGVANLCRVAPELYRSAQPTAEGFRNLQRLGIRSVISLRQTVEDAPAAAGTGLDLTRIPMKSRYVAERSGAKVVASMQALKSALTQGPVLVHCHHGADRTGLIVALYRIFHEGWSREAAIAELEGGGYGFHPIWANIPRYLRQVDLDELQRRIDA